jgi:hypothetical protein
MKRILFTAAATVVCAMLAPAAAGASIVELGAVASSPLVAPTCPAGVAPAKCTIILTRVTAMETIRGGATYPTTVKQAGRIVAFTVGLSALSPNRTTAHNDIHALDSAYGGTTRLAITVLRPSGNKRLRHFTTVAESPVVHVQPYLGQVVQFPLTTSLAVKPGDIVALTTPTWAPVLSIDLNTKSYAYRQSRSTGCGSTPTSNVAQTVGGTATYGCNYPGTRVEYTATEVTNPLVISPIHAPLARMASGPPSPAGGSGLP